MSNIANHLAALGKLEEARTWFEKTRAQGVSHGFFQMEASGKESLLNVWRRTVNLSVQTGLELMDLPIILYNLSDEGPTRRRHSTMSATPSVSPRCSPRGGDLPGPKFFTSLAQHQ